MDKIKRRSFLQTAVGAVAAYITPITIGAEVDSTQRYSSLMPAQARTYTAWCELLVKGSAAAGVAKFTDKQLNVPYDHCLLMARFLENPPLTEFYHAGIAGIDQESRARFKRNFIALDLAEQTSIVDAAGQSKTRAWTQPTPSLFYLVSRSDAIDVVYGTEQGFEHLRIPYLAHIAPDKPW